MSSPSQEDEFYDSPYSDSGEVYNAFAHDEFSESEASSEVEYSPETTREVARMNNELAAEAQMGDDEFAADQSNVIRFPNDTSRPLNLPYGDSPAHRIIPIHNRAVKAFDTLLSRIKRSMDLTKFTVDGCVKELKLLDLDKHPEHCQVREKFITLMKESVTLSRSKVANFEDVSGLLEYEIKSIIREHFPQNVEDFVRTNLLNLKSKKPMWFPLPPSSCQICFVDQADCRIMPGDSKLGCSCKDMGICMECMLRHYWVNSDKNRKSFATCPTCRGEFSLRDILYVKYENMEAARERDGKKVTVTWGIPKSTAIEKRRPSKRRQVIRPVFAPTSSYSRRSSGTP